MMNYWSIAMIVLAFKLQIIKMEDINMVFKWWIYPHFRPFVLLSCQRISEKEFSYKKRRGKKKTDEDAIIFLEME